MKLQDCIDFARQHPVCFLATADRDQPRVRAFLFWIADETGFYFATFAAKDVFRQMRANPKVEICFFNHGELGSARTLRVTGVVTVVNDPVLRDRLFREWPWLREFSRGADDPAVQLLRVANGEAFFWTMADVLRERSLERVAI